MRVHDIVHDMYAVCRQDTHTRKLSFSFSLSPSLSLSHIKATVAEEALLARRDEAQDLREEANTLRAGLIACQERLTHTEQKVEGCRERLKCDQQVHAQEQADANTRREEAEKELVVLSDLRSREREETKRLMQNLQQERKSREDVQQQMEAVQLKLLSLYAQLEEQEVTAAAAVAGKREADEALLLERKTAEARSQSDRQQVQQALDDLNTMRTQIKDKDSTLDSRWADVEQLRGALKEANSLNSKLDGESRGLRELLAELREHKFEADANSKSMADKLLTINTEVAQAKATGAAAVARAEAAAEKITSLSEDYEKLERARAAALEAGSVHEQSAAELKHKVRQLETEKKQALEAYSAAVAAAKTATDFNIESADTLAVLQSQLSTSQGSVHELKELLKRKDWEMQDVSVSEERENERLQSLLEAKKSECKALREEVESGLERRAEEALGAEQERGKVLKRASRAEALVQAVQKELLDLTCDGLRMREEHEASLAVAAQKEEALRSGLRASEEQVQEERNQRQDILQQLRVSKRTEADFVSARSDARVAEARAMAVEKEMLCAIDLLERLCGCLRKSMSSHTADVAKLDACQQRMLLAENELPALRAGESAAYDKAGVLEDQLTAALAEIALVQARVTDLNAQLEAQKTLESTHLLQISALEQERGRLSEMQRDSEEQARDLHAQLLLSHANVTYHDQEHVLARLEKAQRESADLALQLHAKTQELEAVQLSSALNVETAQLSSAHSTRTQGELTRTQAEVSRLEQEKAAFEQQVSALQQELGNSEVLFRNKSAELSLAVDKLARYRGEGEGDMGGMTPRPGAAMASQSGLDQALSFSELGASGDAGAGGRGGGGERGGAHRGGEGGGWGEILSPRSPRHDSLSRRGSLGASTPFGGQPAPFPDTEGARRGDREGEDDDVSLHKGISGALASPRSTVLVQALRKQLAERELALHSNRELVASLQKQGAEAQKQGAEAQKVIHEIRLHASTLGAQLEHKLRMLQEAAAREEALEKELLQLKKRVVYCILVYTYLSVHASSAAQTCARYTYAYTLPHTHAHAHTHTCVCVCVCVCVCTDQRRSEQPRQPAHTGPRQRSKGQARQPDCAPDGGASVLKCPSI